MKQSIPVYTAILANPAAPTLAATQQDAPTDGSATPAVPGSTTWHYLVVAIAANGSVSAPLAVSTSTGQSTLTTPHKNALAWTDPAGDFDHIEVYRVSGTDQGLIGSVAPAAEALDDTGQAADSGPAIPAEVTFGYAVTAVDAAGNETLAGVATVDNYQTQSGVNKNTITPAAVSNADHYRIYREAGGASQGYIADSDGSAVHDDGIAADGTHPPAENQTGAGLGLALNPSRNHALIEVTGTFVATVLIQGSSDGRGWHTLARTTGKASFRVPARRYRYLRAKVAAYTSGTPVVTVAA